MFRGVVFRLFFEVDFLRCFIVILRVLSIWHNKETSMTAGRTSRLLEWFAVVGYILLYFSCDVVFTAVQRSPVAVVVIRRSGNWNFRSHVLSLPRAKVP